MDAKEKVLATMKEAGQPLNAGKIAELSGLDRKEVDAAMKQLKAEGAISCALQMGTCRVRFILLS
ncbi:MAG: transcriptional regulator [Bacteroides caccae]